MQSPGYNYIITGAGCAGSSLLMRMMGDVFFRDKKILIIDRSPKISDDRTWCFWEKEADLFEPIVHHRFSRLDFFSDTFSATLSIDPYRYKMIRSIDLYNYVQTESKKHPNITWQFGNVESITTQNKKAVVRLNGETLTADLVFNSILFSDPTLIDPHGDALLQHFKGWFIETPAPAFDAGRATFMDFRVGQDEGTTFAYMLPTSSTTALVEHTLFTKQVLAQDQYDGALRKYIQSTLGIDEYAVRHEEFGVIPMTGKKFSLQDGCVVNIGVAGGQVKASSGYAFRFIQKKTKSIVEKLKQGKIAFHQTTFADRKFRFYDRVLLHVLSKNKMPGPVIFARIFQHNKPERVLQFLDNESDLGSDLRIMSSVPSSVFLPAAIRTLFR